MCFEYTKLCVLIKLYVGGISTHTLYIISLCKLGHFSKAIYVHTCSTTETQLLQCLQCYSPPPFMGKVYRIIVHSIQLIQSHHYCGSGKTID